MTLFDVRPEDIGERVDVVLARRMEVTRTLAQRALKSGEVTVGGRQVRPSHRLEEDEIFEGSLPEPVAPTPEAEDIPIEVLYEDEELLVVNKPAGLVTHPAQGHAVGTLVNALLGLGIPLSGRGSVRPGIVHRLDKETSGLLLVAKTDAVQDRLVSAIRERRVERAYLALVRGRMDAPSGTMEAPVGRHPLRRRQMAVVPGGKPSVTHYRTVAESAELSLLEVTLETGRTHQIRVHLAHLGHPVLGDRVYGGVSDLSRRLGLTRPFLHAHRLTFTAPSKAAPVTVTSPLPEDLDRALAAASLAPEG